MMRRIVIFGCSGAGKSTLARQMAERLGLPIVHLDMLYWRPGWQVPDTPGFLARVAAAIAGETWITEGNYRETFALRLPRADAVIILESSRWLRVWRVLRRTILERHTRPDLPEGCPERFDWDLLKFIWRFDRVTWPRIEVARLTHGPEVPVIRLRNGRDIAAFLATLPRVPPSSGR
jgi:adenylate kinase family enzyme